MLRQELEHTKAIEKAAVVACQHLDRGIELLNNFPRGLPSCCWKSWPGRCRSAVPPFHNMPPLRNSPASLARRRARNLVPAKISPVKAASSGDQALASERYRASKPSTTRE